jgi:tetratricopeptide (TPR) repeat protein
MGKSRLAREFMDRADARGVNAAVGYCWEGGGSPAFWPWGSLLQELSLSEDAELGEPLSPEAAPTRFRLFADVAGALRDAAERQPLVLILEDVHWAEESTLMMTKFIVEQLQRSRLLIACTCRDSGLAGTDPRGSSLAQLAQLAEPLALKPLGDAEIASLLRNFGMPSVDSTLVGDVAYLTGGNPLFVRGIAPLLRDSRSFGAGTLLRATIPTGIREALQAQLKVLDPVTRDVLGEAAVLGDEFSLTVLDQISGLPVDQTAEALEQATRHHLLEESGYGQFRFAHALLRETLYGSLAVAKRTRLHLDAARAYERLGLADLDENAGKLADHYLRTLPREGTLERAIDCTLRAADWAVKNLAYEQARDLYKRAVELIAQAPSNVERGARASVGLGNAQRLCGNGEDAKHTFSKLAENARGWSRPDLFAEAALGYGRAHFENGYVERTLVEMIEEALAKLATDDSTTRIALLCRLAKALQFDPDLTRRTLLADEAVASARRLGDDATLAQALESRLWTCWSSSNPTRRVQASSVAREAIESAHRAGLWETVSSCRIIRSACLLAEGSGPEAQAEFEQAAVLVDRLQHPVHLWFVELSRAAWALIEGRLDDGERLAVAAFQIGQKVQPTLSPVFFAAQSMMLARDRGNLAHWVAGLRASPDADSYSMGMVKGLGALGDLEVGNIDSARAELQALLAPGLDRHWADPNWPSIMTMAAEVAAAVGDRDAGKKLYRALTPHRSLIACMGSLTSMHGVAAHSLGLLAVLLGEADEAMKHLEQALELARGIGARPWQARCELALGELCFQLGDEERARRLLTDCRTKAEAIGMRHLLTRVTALEVFA